MGLAIGLGLGLSFGQGRGGGLLNAFSPVKSKIAAGQNVELIAISDSTANATDEFIYLAFAQIAAQNPQRTFVYIPSNAPASPITDGGYGTPVTVQTGTGAGTVTLRNNAISGERIEFPLGGFFPTAFPVTPDLVLWNHGKNHTGGLTTETSWPILAGEFWNAFATVQDAFPNVQQVAIKQYVNSNNSDMDAIYAAFDLITPYFPELLVIDFSGIPFNIANYIDGPHMTAAANAAELVPRFMAAWNGARAGAFAAAAPVMTTKVVNHLDADVVDYVTRTGVQGDFNDSANGASTPAGFTASGTPVLANELTKVVAPRTKALSMAGSGAASPRINKPISTARRLLIAGQRVFLIGQRYNDPNSDTTVGRLGISFTSPSVNGGSPVVRTTRTTNKGAGGHRYVSIGPIDVPPDITAASVIVYFDSDSTPDTEAIAWQKVVLAISPVPRDTL